MSKETTKPNGGSMKVVENSEDVQKRIEEAGYAFEIEAMEAEFSEERISETANNTASSSSSDGTKKYLFDVLDGNAIETVLMSYHHGYSLCVSSQIGCKMGCKFCASTGINFIRSLSSGEIVEQILAVQRDENIKIRVVDKFLYLYRNTINVFFGESCFNFASINLFEEIPNIK